MSSVMLSVEEAYRTYDVSHVDLMHSNGTSALDALLPTLPLYFSAWLAVLLTTVATVASPAHRFLMEFALVIAPYVVYLTVLAGHLNRVLLALLTVLSIAVLFIRRDKFRSTGGWKVRLTSKNTSYITNLRAHINISTVISILAVDFNIFPRGYAKTEDFGHSFMDFGVGMYVFINGVVAPESKGRRGTIWNTVKSCVPLLVLGCLRVLLTRQLEYNVPYSEYGSHWNFFFTLAFTKIISSLILNAFGVRYVYINSILLLLSHEMLLQAGLQKFVLSTVNRDTFFRANREGIVSVLGYVSLYLFSVHFGYLIQSKMKKNHLTTILFCFKATLLTLALSFLFQYHYGISRRLANAAFCLWISAVSCFTVGMYLIFQTGQEFLFDSDCAFSPIIFEAVNYNALVFFMIANVLTGLINLNYETLDVNALNSLIIIVVYMFVNCLVVYVLYRKKMKLRV